MQSGFSSSRFIAVVAFMTTVLGVAPVLAEGPVEVFLTVKPPEVTGKNHPPQLEATIVGGPALPIERFTLVEPGAKTPHVAKAVSLRRFTPDTDTLAVAFVFNGQEVWVGNDDYEPDDSPARYLGALKHLKTALQHSPLAAAGPASKGALISYGAKANVMIAMGPLVNIRAEALGTQKDYKNEVGTAMVDGIRLGLAELHNVTASRKALVIVGDGNDTNPEAARAQLADLKTQAVRDQIQTFAIIYKGQLSDPDHVITTMIPNATTVDDAKDIETALDAILSRMADRYYVTFSGYDPTTKQGLAWDGKAHDLVVKLDHHAADPVTLTLSPVWNPPTNGGFPWWIALVGGALLLIVIGASFARKKAGARTSR